MPFQSCLRALTAAVVVLLLVAARASAHAELVSSVPGDGADLATSPAAITAIYSEEIDPSRSSMTLRDAAGATLATGGVDSADPDSLSMRIDLPDPLSPGAYQVRWTTVTSDDDAVERGTFSFTVEAAAATVSPTASSTPVPSSTPAGSPTPTASSTPAGSLTLAPSSAPAASPTPRTSATPRASSQPTPSPTAAPSGSGSQTGSGSSDALLPVIVAGIAVIAAAAFLVARRRRDGGSPAG